MLKFSEIFEFSKEKFRKIPILKEFEWFEWFEWFDPSPIEPFNSPRDHLPVPVHHAAVGSRPCRHVLVEAVFILGVIPPCKRERPFIRLAIDLHDVDAPRQLEGAAIEEL